MAERHSVDFHEIFTFLSDHSWIHQVQLTQYFVEKIWTNIPEEWNKVLSSLSAEQLSKLPFEVGGQCTSDIKLHFQNPPRESLASFLQKSVQLSCERQQARHLLSPTPIDRELSRGMASKKVHEVEWMASLVHRVTSESGCDTVVDVGSGLGYLGQVLHKVYGLPVIGVEGNAGHNESAASRACKQGMECSGLKTITLEICDGEDNLKNCVAVINEAVLSLSPCQHTSRNVEGSNAATNQMKYNTEENITNDTEKTGNKERHCGLEISETTRSAKGQCETKSPWTECGCHVYDGEKVIDKLTDSDHAEPEAFGEEKAVSECLHDPESAYITITDTMRSESPLNCLHCRNTSGGNTDRLSHSQNSSTCKDQNAKCHLNSQQGWTTRNKHFNESRCTLTSIPCMKTNIEKGGRKVCLIGLHCCGDLSPVMLKLFLYAEFIGAIILVSCCYHKMCKISGSDQFCNFPLSESAIQAYSLAQKKHSTLSSPFLSTGSLRLAAQETRTRWEAQREADHDNHARNLAYRALLEVFLSKQDYVMHHLFTLVLGFFFLGNATCNRCKLRFCF
ncbi:uncharacterized protein LOC112558162 isoform X3 [Pomacea canaliculata]|uniref:uncharacterized protein LOC112558162 isoform X3 n=1 Tax=Pomacea canaliculata TaxID=400727 RepID=UPI000D74000F|nr:uncharacterized protein LOC112558162 isoform X3 [Pomacea canaliculata]